MCIIFNVLIRRRRTRV